ncbi:MAG TPA: Ppx/GppA phosphatase family protein [Baekduia sp.]|nr:Ppx/GppA phosphatase family protein [Baekduia sp.]
MRVGIVDIGTNSTRLLAADVTPDGRVTELERRSEVTRLGQGVDRTGALADEAMDRVRAVLDEYRRRLDHHGVTATRAVLTSAVRDASNGAAFTAEVRERYGLDARELPGHEEARLTFLGATSERPLDGTRLVVVDIGGGSTELVVGEDREVLFEVSTQAGVVRQTERHIHHDPPEPEELQAMAEEVAAIFAESVPADVRDSVRAGIAVAGTATSCAAIVQHLDPYDPERVHGFRLLLGQTEEQLARLAAMPLAERREVAGLHPDRAPTIVAGVVLLQAAMRAFGLDEVEVSEHDILRGAALDLAAG